MSQTLTWTLIRIDNDPRPEFREYTTDGGFKCEERCYAHVQESYTFATDGESIVERDAKVQREWKIQQTNRENERLKKERASRVYTGEEEAQEKMAEQSDDRNKRVKMDTTHTEETDDHHMQEKSGESIEEEVEGWKWSNKYGQRV